MEFFDRKGNKRTKVAATPSTSDLTPAVETSISTASEAKKGNNLSLVAEVVAPAASYGPVPAPIAGK